MQYNSERFLKIIDIYIIILFSEAFNTMGEEEDRNLIVAQARVIDTYKKKKKGEKVNNTRRRIEEEEKDN